MRWMIIIITLMILVSFNVLSATAPTPDFDSSGVIINKIDTEAKNTRQFLSNELTKREESFTNEFTKRADYYESAYQDILNKAVLKLGLFWSGIMIFFLSLNKIMMTRAEKKRYAVMKEAIKKDIIAEFNTDKIKVPVEDINMMKELKEELSPKKKEKKEKKGFFSRKKKDKESKESKDIEELKKLIKELKDKDNNGFGGEQKEQSFMDKIKRRQLR